MEIASVQPAAERPRRSPRAGAAEHWVFPGLVTAMVVGNQLWSIGPFLAGQMISWAVDLAAFIVLVRFFPTRAWPSILPASCSRDCLTASAWEGSLRYRTPPPEHAVLCGWRASYRYSSSRPAAAVTARLC